MNIFVLDKDPKKCASYHSDKHVVKMILETAQILSTVRSFYGVEAYYKPTHQNHPCVKWARSDLCAFLWLCKLGVSLCKEYTKRYKKIHKCEPLIRSNYNYITKLPFPKSTFGEEFFKTFAQAMPDEHKDEDVVKAYRNYYIFEKSDICDWAYGDRPEWWPGEDTK